MSVEEIGTRRRAIKSALWLWFLFGVYAEQSEAEWWPVAGGEEFTDEKIGILLDVKAAKAKKWRQRLELHGMLRSELTKSRTRRFWFYNPDSANAQKVSQKIPSPFSNMVN
jgi:hypothetical protein